MPERLIPLNQGQASGLDDLAGAQPRLWNFMVEATGAMRVRPGITAWTDFAEEIPDLDGDGAGSPVIGKSAFGQYLVFVCEDRSIWARLGPSNVIPLSDGTSATKLDGTERPVFAYDSQRIVIAGGGALQKWEGSGLSSRLGGSPPNATHVAYMAQRFVVNGNDNSGILYWTPPGVGNHESWDTGLDFAEAEAAPDPTMAIHANTREVFAFGTQTLQVFVPDPAVGFSVVSAINLGCGARYSIIDTDGSFAWLDEKRRIVKSDGRSFEVISSPGMTADLAQFDTVSDCWGARCRIGSFDVFLWVFPTEGRAIYYEQTAQKWGEWRSTGNSGDWAPWIAQSYYYWADQNLHLVGLEDGSIALLTFDAYTDNGLTIKAVSRTGFDDAGVTARKLCQNVVLRMRRGSTTVGETTPQVLLSYRDDLGAFQQAITYDLGAGDYSPQVDTWAVGMFEQRQWELTFTDAAQFVLTKAVQTLQEADV